MNNQKAIHLEFHETGAHFYFGSISAIFALFNAHDLGVSQSRIYGFKIEPGKPYVNKIITIRKGPLYRKKGNRTRPNI
jgi:hypothetical protein